MAPLSHISLIPLRLGSQSKEEMKLDIRNVDGEITAIFSVTPPQSAPFKIDNVYTQLQFTHLQD